jgi:SAM-dependent methyltransferase
MQIDRAFYERLHSENDLYGRARYDVHRLLGGRAFRDWSARFSDREVRLLDIGCGKGTFLLELSRSLAGRYGLRIHQVTAVDLVKAEPNVFREIVPPLEFHQRSVDGGEALPFAAGAYDLICCNHVLEHIFETEKFLREIRRVLSKDGLAVISVPNIAAWMNRIAFLFGGQPLGSEVGTERVTYGFWPAPLKERLSSFSPSGHIRDFTPGGLRDLALACGFKQVGWWAQNGGLFIAMNPKLGRNLGILLEPSGDSAATNGTRA